MAENYDDLIEYSKTIDKPKSDDDYSDLIAAANGQTKTFYGPAEPEQTIWSKESPSALNELLNQSRSQHLEQGDIPRDVLLNNFTAGLGNRLPAALEFLKGLPSGLDAAKQKYNESLNAKVAEQDKFSQENPLQSGVLAAGGQITSPINAVGKIGGAITKIPGINKAPGLVKDILSAGVGGAAQNTVFAAGLADPEESANLGQAAAMGAGLSVAGKFAPLATTAGTLASMATDDKGPGMDTSTMVAGGLGLAGDLLTKSKTGSSKIAQLLDPKRKALASSAKMKAPLEKLEQGYFDIGEKVEPERRASEKLFSTPRGSPMSDELRHINDKIDDINIRSNTDLSKPEKEMLGNNLIEIADIKFKTLSEAYQDKSSFDKLLKVIDEQNRSRGIKEDAIESLNKQINLLKASNPNPSYNPMNENLSNVVIGRAMQTPYRHSQALATALTIGGVEKLSPREVGVYENLLKINQDIKAGQLNKWMQGAEEHGLQTPRVTRYFNGSQQISPDELASMQLAGVKVFPSHSDFLTYIERTKGEIPASLSPNAADLKLLQNTKAEIQNKSFDPIKGKFVSSPQDLIDLQSNLRNLGEQSKWADLPNLTNNKDEMVNIYRNYKGSPDKFNQLVEEFSKDGMAPGDIVKLLSEKPNELNDYLNFKKSQTRAQLSMDKAEIKSKQRMDILAQKDFMAQDFANKTEDFNKRTEEFQAGLSAEAAPYEEALRNMSEGKRQLRMNAPESIPMRIAKGIPGVDESLKGINQFKDIFTKEGQLKRFSANEEYYRDLYQKGKIVENKAQTMKPMSPDQVANSFVSNPDMLSKLENYAGQNNSMGNLGDIVKNMLQDLHQGNGVAAQSKGFLLSMNPEFRRLFSGKEEDKQALP